MALRLLAAALCLSSALAWKPSLAGSRRDVLSQVGALSGLSALGLAAPALAATKQQPLEDLAMPLNRILRVIEATTQEERLIRTGKFKDLQRANVKYAVELILNNYRLQENINLASAFVEPSSVLAATEKGRQAVEYLVTVQEYFDSGKQSLQVGEMSSDKLGFTLKALGAARQQLEGFVSYLPQDAVKAQLDVIAEENRLNQLEYDGDLLNMPKPDQKS